MHGRRLQLLGLGFPLPSGKAGRKDQPGDSGVGASFLPFLHQGRVPVRLRGHHRYDPLIKMHTLGHSFVPDPIHAGGLRYHGMSPLLSHIYESGLIEAEAIGQTECFAAGVQFARTEGIVPAPEPAHALASAIRVANECRESGEEKVILTALCGHGSFDLAAYDNYLAGGFTDYEYPDEKVAEAMKSVPVVA